MTQCTISLCWQILGDTNIRLVGYDVSDAAHNTVTSELWLLGYQTPIAEAISCEQPLPAKWLPAGEKWAVVGVAS